MNPRHAFLLAIFIAAGIPGLYAINFSGSVTYPNPDTTGVQLGSGEFTVENNGLTLWYKVSGRGPVCLLPTPGWGPGSELYYRSMEQMEEMFTMVYLDTRGSGRSDKPKMEQYTTSNFLSDLEAVRNDLGVQKVWLMGHSKGGALVLNYAFHYKENVQGIILIDASGGVNTPPEKMQAMIQQRQDEPWFESAAEYFTREPHDEKDWITGIQAIMPVYFSTIEKFEESKEVLVGTSLSYHAFQGQGNWYDCEHELGTKLPRIETPVLIIVGMDDFICGPFVALNLHRELPNSKLLPVEDAGHFPWMEKPDFFFQGINDFMPFLE
jgi:proline iminopeptidase